MNGLVHRTRKGRKLSNLLPIIAMPTTFSAITLNWSYLRLQRPDLLAITSPSGAF
jgi:hypothetical protein